MRECRQNYAHGPMKLKSKTVVVAYKGIEIECEKSFYACDFCDYEHNEKWMNEKLEEQLARLYAEQYGKAG